MPVMEAQSVLLLRAALALYSLGLGHALYSVVRQSHKLFLPALYAFGAGAAAHCVSLVMLGTAQARCPVQTLQQMSSMAAFSITVVFLAAYWRFRYESLAAFVFPIVFVLTLVGALGDSSLAVDRSLNRWWLSVHVVLFLFGYAALFLTFVAGVMYLIQERELKSKRPRAFYYRLPPLGKLDEIGYQALAVGFVLVTLGLIAASIWAFVEWGANWVIDPTIALAFLTWAIYLAMVFSRLAIGWRGRKGAYFSIAGFGCAALTWMVNSGMHSFMNR